MADKEKSKIHPLVSMMAVKVGKVDDKGNPNEDYDNDQAMDDAVTHLAGITEENKNLQESQAKIQEANDKLAEAIETEPELAAVLKDCIAGIPFRAAIARHFDPSELEPQEGDPDYEAAGKMRAERLQNIADGQKMQAEHEANKSEVVKNINEFLKEEGLEGEESDAAVKQIDDIIQNLLNYKLDKPTIQKLHRAHNFDKHIEDAKEQGRVEGRNEQIEAKKQKSVVKQDDIPSLTPGGETETPEAKPVKKGSMTPLSKDYVKNLTNR